ncbi:prolactin-3B1-like [Phodopus roborovskii]|uniref:prolactin-3B1-like n=1 Tax=Phodopus roborovskii TaxID=109678 RepID=UPI0021E45C80|nr:prolactin-3B1-like [Phodopus roborovskii]
MKLSLTELSFSGTLLFLTMSNLLPWEHVASSPDSHLSTGSLYQRMVELSHYTHALASKVFSDFNMKFGRSIWRQNLLLSTCHTASIPAPENREQVHQTKIQPRSVEDEFTSWSGWLDLQSSDEATRNLALYTLARCIRRDTHKVDNYLKVLKCRDVHNNNC